MQNGNFGTFILSHIQNLRNEIELLKEENQKFKLEQLKQCQVYYAILPISQFKPSKVYCCCNLLNEIELLKEEKTEIQARTTETMSSLLRDFTKIIIQGASTPLKMNQKTLLH